MELAGIIETACLWEAEAPKAGNVHPKASFDDVSYEDFVHSARIAAFMLARVDTRGVSQSILDAVRAVNMQVGKNTNLGIVLLLGPMVAVAKDQTLQQGLPSILDALNVEDSCRIYEAINIAKPGGLSQVGEQDVLATPTENVRSVMELAQQRDTIAKQYTNNFQDVLDFGLTRLAHWWSATQGNRNQAIVGLHLDWMANYPDTLILRKCGAKIAEESAARAKEVLESNWSEAPQSLEKFAEFDDWLRTDSNKRNPGTSADLVAACLFAGLREGIIS
ncbi:MAG: triphosphoribosyl-dephospho-CoA synthase [Planctomycetaceae bacterium]|nr:triphosphoribosyl-dephospho-CoA synthase [Planctomycetaceae bacterium]